MEEVARRIDDVDADLSPAQQRNLEMEWDITVVDRCELILDIFATLDPTTRSFDGPGNRRVLITDTVGFIRKLPHALQDAFRSTLEEAVFADVILHVADASSPELDQHIATT